MQALAATKGNITAAAKKLGISRRTLHRKLNEMNEGKATETIEKNGPEKKRSETED
jgi:DNA-binding NtrC family response regulator